MSEQPDNVNERLARLELVAELVPDVLKSTRSALKVLGDMAAAVDNLAAGQSAISSRVGDVAEQMGEVAVRVGDLQQAVADTEQTFKETRAQILEGVQDLEIHLAIIEERLATLEDER